MDKKYKKLIDKSYLNMSSFQIKRFIIEDQLTDYKKIKQALLELRTRYEQYDDLMEDIELRKIEIEKIKNKIEKINMEKNFIDNKFEKKEKEFEIKEQEINLKRANRILKTLYQKIDYLVEEIKTFEEILDNYLNLYDEKELEEILKNSDKNYEYEKNYWIEKFTRSAVFELLGHGRISSNLMEAISNLDKKSQAEVLYKTFEHFENLKKTLSYVQEDVNKELSKKEFKELKEQEKNEK
jgi:hypothetical protein